MIPDVLNCGYAPSSRQGCEAGVSGTPSGNGAPADQGRLPSPSWRSGLTPGARLSPSTVTSVILGDAV